MELFQFYTEKETTVYTAQKTTFENKPIYIVMWKDTDGEMDTTTFECETVEYCVNEGFWIKKVS
jgi:hypothetical protein